MKKNFYGSIGLPSNENKMLFVKILFTIEVPYLLKTNHKGYDMAPMPRKMITESPD